MTCGRTLRRLTRWHARQGRLTCGCELGWEDGIDEGQAEMEGRCVGCPLGIDEGCTLGWLEGLPDGFTDGKEDAEGCKEGWLEG